MSAAARKTAAAARLGWPLVFAVVYADIGSSVFYVPGILYLSIGNLAALAQVLTTVVFVLVALKYVEICHRCPDGGGVVSVIRQAFPTWTVLPLLGGSLITVDYFLTSAISAVSGVYYLSHLVAGWKAYVVPITLGVLVILWVLNVVGLRESASVASWFAGAQILVTGSVVALAAAAVGRAGGFANLAAHVLHPGVPLTATALAIGYADSWLAFSGLESLSQVSGAMRPPVRKTARAAMWFLILVISVFSTPVTAFETYLLPVETLRGEPESLLAALAYEVGGPLLGGLLVLTASTLLFMACNTALVGNYHVNLRLADLGFLAEALRRRSKRFGTPHVSIAVSALVPMGILVATRGSVTALGDLYAFGLLGTLTLSSAAVDRLRWRDGERGALFWAGAATTAALAVAWGINIFHKPHATLFGGGIAGVLLVLGALHRRRAEAEAAVEIAEAEREAAESPAAERLLTLDEAVDLKAVESSSTLVSLRYFNRRLLDVAVTIAKGRREGNVYVVYVDEMPGLYAPPEVEPSPEARRTLEAAARHLEAEDLVPIPVWRLAEDAGRSVAEAARSLGVKTVLVGASQRTFFWRMLRGRVLRRLAERLPEACRLVVVG